MVIKKMQLREEHRTDLVEVRAREGRDEHNQDMFYTHMEYYKEQRNWNQTQAINLEEQLI